jgi:hypothetical protein
MAVVVFDVDAFRLRYPEFAAVTDAQLQAAFDDAGLYLDNTDASPVPAPTPRTQLLYMLTAHITALTYGANGAGAAPFVGRVSSVTEGSVSISADMSGWGAGSAWYLQTPYGAAYWQATINYRLGSYVPACRPYYAR